MLEIAKNLLLCQNHHGQDDNSDLEGLTPREERTEKLKFKLIGLQLVNQIFCRKLRKQREESERLGNNNNGGDCTSVSLDQNKPSSPRLSFSEVHDGECLKSLVAIRFDDQASSQNEDDSARSRHLDRRNDQKRIRMERGKVSHGMLVPDPTGSSHLHSPLHQEIPTQIESSQRASQND